MSSVSQFWAAAALMSCGLFTGGAFFVAVVQAPAWTQVDEEAYVAQFRPVLRRADPLQPVLLVITALCAVMESFSTRGVARDLSLAGPVLLALILALSLIIAKPINRKLCTDPAGSTRVGVSALRSTWATMHRVRTILAVSAFGCLCLAAIWR